MPSRNPEMNRMVKHQSIMKTEREKPINLRGPKSRKVIMIRELTEEALIIFSRSAILV
jgi:hypothetical protein